MEGAGLLAACFMAGFANAADLACFSEVLGADAFFEGVRLSLFDGILAVSFVGDLAGLETTLATLTAFVDGLVELGSRAFPLTSLGFFEFAFGLEAPFSNFGRVATPAGDFPFVLTVAAREAVSFLLFASFLAVGWFFFGAFKGNSWVPWKRSLPSMAENEVALSGIELINSREQ